MFESSPPVVVLGAIASKGTYTLHNNVITFTTTHFHGDNNQSFGEFNFYEFDLESKWYSEVELKTAIEASGKWTEWVEEDFNQSFSVFPPLEISVMGDTLTLTFVLANVTDTFTRVN